MKTRRLFVLLTLVLLTATSNAQSIAELGRKLTQWTLSSDSRRISVNRILLYEYPGSDNFDLLKMIDNFSTNPKDTRMVLVGLYKNNGPDYGYMILREHFSKKELAAIDALYEKEGGVIPKHRTENERIAKSEAAREKGITTDMAKQLSWWCNNTPNTIYYVSSALSDKGYGDLSYYRLMDSFEENLDFAEAVLMTICKMSGGADQAYPILRTFLNQNQIASVGELYSKYKIEQRELREKAIMAFEQQASKDEPYDIDEAELYSLNKKANDKILKILAEGDFGDIEISVTDQITINRNATTDHNITVNIKPENGQLRTAIQNEIQSIKGRAKIVKNDKLGHQMAVASHGEVKVNIDQHIDSTVMQIRTIHDADGYIDVRLMEGNQEVFDAEYSLIKDYIKRNTVTGKKKIRLIRTHRGELVTGKIELVDKKEPIR